MILFTTSIERISTSDLKLLDRFDIQPDLELIKTVNVPLPIRTRKNGTMFIHAFLAKRSYKENWQGALNDPLTTYAAAPLTIYHIPEAAAFNLIHDKDTVRNIEQFLRYIDF
jgi:Cleft lip and palate transmembrane protein 1 (CLPTM1)